MCPKSKSYTAYLALIRISDLIAALVLSPSSPHDLLSEVRGEGARMASTNDWLTFV